MMDNNQIIKINPKKVALILGVSLTLLVFASITGQIIKFKTGHNYVYGFVPRSFLDYEANIPAYFSSVILLFSGFLLGIIAVFKKRGNDLYTLHWKTLSTIFLMLSLDEAAGIYELLIEALHKMFPTQGLARFIPNNLLILVLILFFCRFLFHLPSKTRFLFTIAATIHLGSAVVLVPIAYWYSHVLQYGTENLTYSMIVTLEETLGMAGIIIFIYALLEYMRTNLQEIRFSLKSPVEY